MEVRKLKAILEVAKEKAEAGILAGEAEKEKAEAEEERWEIL